MPVRLYVEIVAEPEEEIHRRSLERHQFNHQRQFCLQRWGGVYIYGTGTANISSDSISVEIPPPMAPGEASVTTAVSSPLRRPQSPAIPPPKAAAASSKMREFWRQPRYFHDNSARFDGGGIANQGSYADTISGCTISGNSSQGRGGGIYNNDSVVALHVTNTVLSGNMCKNRRSHLQRGQFYSSELNYQQQHRAR